MDVKQEITQCWDESSKSYDSLYGHGLKSKAEEEAWKQMLAQLTGTEPLKILDVGTGTGFLALMLADLGHQVTGVDLSEGMMSHARQKAADQGLEVQFLRGDAEHLPQDMEGKFDLVVNRHLLWTLTDPRQALTEWNRVLKPGGRIAIIDGNWRDVSAGDKVKKFIGNVLILVTEFRNPWHQHKGYPKALREQLPLSRNGARPQVKAMVEGCGFENIQERWLTDIDDTERAAMPWKVRLTKTYHRHLLTAEKI